MDLCCRPSACVIASGSSRNNRPERYFGKIIAQSSFRPHDGPAFGGSFIERLVEFADMRVPVVGPLALSTGMMNDQGEARTRTAGCPSIRKIPSELPKAATGRRSMRLWILDGLAGFVINEVEFGQFPITYLPSRSSNFSLPLLPTTSSGGMA